MRYLSAAVKAATDHLSNSRQAKLSLSVSLLILASSFSITDVSARGGRGGGGGGYRGGGGVSEGYPMGGGRGDGVSEGYPMGGGRGDGVSEGYPMGGGRGDGVSEGYGFASGASGGNYGRGAGRYGYGRGGYGGGYGDADGYRTSGDFNRAPSSVSDAQRMQSADQSYKWGFDKGNTSEAIHSAQTVSPAAMVDRAGMVRDNYNHWDAFHGDNWWRSYPNAWRVPGWGDYYAWGWSNWNDMVGLMGLAAATSPDYYDYGGSITIVNNQVYYGSQPVASTSQYYDQAQAIADGGDTSQVSQAGNWKSLGVYALAQGSQSASTASFELAVDKNGNIGGNYYDSLTNQVTAVRGKIDKKSQRAAWIVGSNKNVVYDTGLGNLLSNQAPLLVHMGKNTTQQWMLVRMQQQKVSS